MNALTNILKYFQIYPAAQAPFLHKQYAEWKASSPMRGLKVLHHVPLVPNTLLKIACLVVSGAEVVVTNPSSFMSAHPDAVSALKKDGIRYVEDLSSLKGETFDLFFDCGAELYQALGAPTLGAVELTASGDQFYRAEKLNFPVLSIDPTFTKQLETLFGAAETASVSIAKLTGLDVAKKSWMVFGFGKIGRGVTYNCVKNKIPVSVVDIDPAARHAAASFGVQAIDPSELDVLQRMLEKTDIVVTATGKKAILDRYPAAWFKGKVLANMGVLDEYGSHFDAADVLNQKLPVNFILDDPTPIQYIDPELYAHNLAALPLLQGNLLHGVSDLSKAVDQKIIAEWCRYHQHSENEITKWFVNV